MGSIFILYIKPVGSKIVMVRPGCGCGQVKWVWLHNILHKIMLVNILGVLNVIGRVLSSDWQLADSLLIYKT